MKHKLGVRLGDIVLMSLILLTALLLFFLPFFWKSGTSVEVLIAESGETRHLSLDVDSSLEIVSQGITLTICIEHGEAFVLHADCPDGICQSSPPVSRAGQSIVCVPAGVVIRVVGEEAVVDGVSR